jgi:pimeloyl-ACP methyl ester carboxylesterase
MGKIKEYSVDYVISKDGTKIGYKIFGQGSGIILVHGGLMSSQNFTVLAKNLSANFTVYVPDRRGRGLSSETKNHSLVAESEDIQAIIDKTNAENIFGLSSGAIITIKTALGTPKLKKIAIYEPPVTDNWKITDKWYQNYKLALNQNNYGKAFVNIMKVAKEKSWITILPQFIVATILNFGIKSEKIVSDEMSLKELISLYEYDFRIAIESKGLVEKCKELKDRNVLLLEGENSYKWIKEIIKTLVTILPEAKHKELKKCTHNAADNSEKPIIVAEALKDFFINVENASTLAAMLLKSRSETDVGFKIGIGKIFFAE